MLYNNNVRRLADLTNKTGGKDMRAKHKKKPSKLKFKFSVKINLIITQFGGESERGEETPPAPKGAYV